MGGSGECSALAATESVPPPPRAQMARMRTWRDVHVGHEACLNKFAGKSEVDQLCAPPGSGLRRLPRARLPPACSAHPKARAGISCTA